MSLRRVAPAALAVLVAAGCGGVFDRTPEPTAVPTASATAPPTAALPSDPPVSTLPSSAVSAAPSVAPSVSVAPPSAAPTPAESATPAPAGAAACAGNDENRDFYVAVAEAVDWAVLCPVLPDGWFVDAGSYRLAGGGRLEIGYRGPAGARLELREGAFCPDRSGCVPSGEEVDSIAVGPFDGMLVRLDDGGWAGIVDRGATLSWLAVVQGVDEAAARSIIEGLTEVAG